VAGQGNIKAQSVFVICNSWSISKRGNAPDHNACPAPRICSSRSATGEARLIERAQGTAVSVARGRQRSRDRRRWFFLGRLLLVDVVKIDRCSRLFPGARAVILVSAHLHRACPTELIVLSAISMEKCANDFFARRVRPIGLSGELRHGSPLSIDFLELENASEYARATSPSHNRGLRASLFFVVS
jgi:hypothetical protein